MIRHGSPWLAGLSRVSATLTSLCVRATAPSRFSQVISVNQKRRLGLTLVQTVNSASPVTSSHSSSRCSASACFRNLTLGYFGGFDTAAVLGAASCTALLLASSVGGVAKEVTCVACTSAAVLGAASAAVRGVAQFEDFGNISEPWTANIPSWCAEASAMRWSYLPRGEFIRVDLIVVYAGTGADSLLRGV